MSHVDPSAILKYTAIHTAIHRLRDFTKFGPGLQPPVVYIEESARLVALLFLSVRLAEYLRDPLSPARIAEVETINSTLEAKRELWTDSVEGLLGILSQNEDFGVDNIARTLLVLKLMDVARLLGFPSWVKVKKRLCEILLFEDLEVDTTYTYAVCADADVLFAEVRGAL